MSETALKFGPEWLRALSRGGVSSPPGSPGPVKFKLAEFHYGREEMLALFSKDFPPPEETVNLGSLCLEKLQVPLAFLPMNIEEQRIWQRCGNSEAVLRGTGRAPNNGVGRGRGGSVDRGRGRGRGVGAPYYSRGLSYDEESEGRSGSKEGVPPGMMGTRGKSFERSQSINEVRAWGERVSNERGGSDERSGATSPRKEQNRAASTENWRSRASEEEKDRWKALGSSSRVDKWGGRGGWRDRENGDTEWDESRGTPGGTSRSNRPPWEMNKNSQRRNWDEDNLPEWATEDAEEKGGSFDATGAFHTPGSPDESDHIIEADRLEESLQLKRKSTIEVKGLKDDRSTDWEEDKNSDFSSEVFVKNINETKIQENDHDIDKEQTNVRIKQPSPLMNGIISEEEETSTSSSPLQGRPKSKPFSTSIIPTEGLNKPSQYEEDKLDHMQSVADDLVAKLVEDDDSNKSHTHIHHPPPPGGFLPQGDHLTSQEEQWYYTDPQGDIQGPFSSSEMGAWYKAGYFTSNLLLRRHCDDKFAQLGDLTRVFGRVPFLPGPVVPPLKVSELLNAQKAQAERERFELMQSHQMQKQIYQQQLALRQQQQVFQQLQNLDEWSTLSPSQQQQLFMQHMALPHLAPPTIPSALQSQPSPPSFSSSGNSTASTTALQPSTTDLRSSMSSSANSGLSQPQDPIQALVAQMNTPKSLPLANSEPHIPSMPPSSSESVPVGGESPLHKLLLQLQRGSQGTNAGGGLTTSNTSSSTFAASHPPNLGVMPPSSINVEKTNEQFDPIQSLMNQLTKMQSQNAADAAAQEEQRQREEEQKKIEEERRKFEEQKRLEEERIKQQEMRLQEERQREEEKRKQLEEKNKKLEEELRKIQIEQEKKKEEDKKKDEERKRIQLERQKLAEREAAKREEELRRQQKLKQKQEEDIRRKEELARKQEEERQRIEEEKRKKEEKKKLEEERKRKEEERLKREERERQLQIQEEMKRLAVEEEKKRMKLIKEEEKRKTALEEQEKRQHQLQQEKLKQNTSPAWNNSNLDKASAPSLAEIQKAQELREKKEREAELQREVQRHREAMKQAAEEKKQKEINNKWGSRSSQSGKKANGVIRGVVPDQNSLPPVKSLLEIQKEEEKELKKRLEKEQAERAAAVSHLSLSAAGVWGSAAQSLSWANRASTGSTLPLLPVVSQPQQQNSTAGTVAWSAIAQTNSNSSSWNHESTQSVNQNSEGGFWDSPENTKTPKSAANSSTTTTMRTTSKSNLSTTTPSKVSNNQSNAKSNKKKSKDESDSVKKLFAESISPTDSFTQWCKNSLQAMKVHASIDIPTFVGFLSDVESPYEVHDYIRSYLGDSKEVKEFAKQYLEKRSKARNAHKIRHEEDNILAPAPAVNPSSSQEFQEVKTRLKKGGRRKMQKVDSSILGFSVSSNERMNVEDN